MVKTAKEQDGPCKFMATGMINALLHHDPSTNWILGQTGLVSALISILRDPLAPARVKADATLGLKHLTTFSQRNREDVLLAHGVQDMIQMLKVRLGRLQDTLSEDLAMRVDTSKPTSESHRTSPS